MPATPGLATRAEVRRTLALDDAPDRPPAPPARLVGPVVHQELVAVAPRLVPERPVAAEGGAHPVDGCAQDSLGFGGNGPPLGRAQAPGLAPRIDPGAMKDLARVDVPDARQPALVQEEVLDRDGRTLGPIAQRPAGGRREHRIGAQDREQGILERAPGRHRLEQAEAARILEPQLGAVGEEEVAMDVLGFCGLRPGVEQPAAAHSQVGEESQVAVEIEEQVLPVAAHAAQRAALQSRRQVAGDGDPQVLAGHLNPSHRAAQNALLQHAAHGLDLGELGHVATLWTARGSVKRRSPFQHRLPISKRSCGSARTSSLRATEAGGILRPSRMTELTHRPWPLMDDSTRFEEFARLATEQRNPRTLALDTLDVPGILGLISAEDRAVPDAVAREIPAIAKAVELVVASFREGGRLIYVGAGTSGRLGVLDASECPPTFGSDPEMVQGLIAGGHGALIRAVEGAEDREDEGAQAMVERNVGPKDTVIGLAASRRTPYVVAALAKARERGARTAYVTCTPREEFSLDVDVAICPTVGPEVIMGSTRMKAGTAQKLVLNMITTAAFVRMGKTFENMMVDLMANSEKLKERSRRTVMTVTGASYEAAAAAIEAAGKSVKTAIVMLELSCSRSEAEERLARAAGFVRAAIGRPS